MHLTKNEFSHYIYSICLGLGPIINFNEMLEDNILSFFVLFIFTTTEQCMDNIYYVLVVRKLLLQRN